MAVGGWNIKKENVRDFKKSSRKFLVGLGRRDEPY
jgi:hypothetical protein